MESAHFELQHDEYLVVFNFYTAMPSLSHGDDNHDPWTDLSQRGGDDVEHPSLIPMDSTITRQAPHGPMTRAHARNIENEVTSFLSEFHSISHENWVLPQTEVLCMIRCQGVDHGEARAKNQAPTVEEKEERSDKREDGEGTSRRAKSLATPGARPPAARVPGHLLQPVGRAPSRHGCPAPCLGAAPATPGCPASSWAWPQPAPGAGPSTLGCPAPYSHPSGGGPDRSGCPHHSEGLRASLGFYPCIPLLLLFGP